MMNGIETADLCLQTLEQGKFAAVPPVLVPSLQKALLQFLHNWPSKFSLPTISTLRAPTTQYTAKPNSPQYLTT